VTFCHRLAIPSYIREPNLTFQTLFWRKLFKLLLWQEGKRGDSWWKRTRIQWIQFWLTLYFWKNDSAHPTFSWVSIPLKIQTIHPSSFENFGKWTSNFLPHTALGLAMNLQLLSSKAWELSSNHYRKNNIRLKINIPRLILLVKMHFCFRKYIVFRSYEYT